MACSGNMNTVFPPPFPLGPVEHVHLRVPFVAIRNKDVNISAVVWPSQMGTLTYFWWFGNSTKVWPSLLSIKADLDSYVQVSLSLQELGCPNNRHIVKLRTHRIEQNMLPGVGLYLSKETSSNCLKERALWEMVQICRLLFFDLESVKSH